jgi:A118 family predicted phage portal protein
MLFAKILAWIREALSKMLKSDNLKSSIGVDVAISPEMANALQKWSLMYANASPWVGGDTKSLNLAASIAAEIARAVTIEMDVQITGSKRAEFLGEQLAPVLNNIRTYTEYAAAKGGLMFKPYIRGESIAIDYVQADMFYPVRFDANGAMTACVFADQRTIGKDYYTRLEYHALHEGFYEIKNTFWKSSARETLGTQATSVPIAEWQELEPEAIIINVEKPLFAYFKMPFANQVDTTSPLGVSVYSRAVDLIQQADEFWSGLLWEMDSGKRALYTDVHAFGKTTAGKPILPNSRLYRLLDLQSRIDGKGFFEDWTPTIREQNYINALDAVLKKIENNCGLAQGTISDPTTVALTATEIKMSRQRTYATITDTQKALQDALDGLLYAMDVWASIGGLSPAGVYTANYSFDDSIVTDYDSQFTQDQQAVTMNKMPGYIFLMRNYNLDETTAKKWIADAQAESPAPSFFPGLE